MTAHPTVSVVIPCFNGARFLRDTLQSAMNQTQPPLEIIVVDDGSTDDSAAVAKSCGPLVRVISQPNQGESVARNRGIDEARGQWIAFLDADDLWEPEKLERQLAVAEADSIACVCNTTFFGEVNKVAPPWTKPAVELGSLEHICDFNSFLPSALIVRADRAPRFPTWTQHGEDYLFSLELAMLGPVAFIDQPLWKYRIHKSGQSSHPETIVRQDKSFVRWFEMNREKLGEQRTNDLRRRQIGYLVRHARLLRQNRRWDSFFPLRDYLQTLPADPLIDKFLRERLWPRWLYGVVDVVDDTFPFRRSSASALRKR